MRFLFTTHPGFGHFNPMIPLGHALQSAGHEVAVATAQSFQHVVEQAGFIHKRAGLEWDESRLIETVPDITNVAQLDQSAWLAKHIFLDRSPRQMVPDLLAIIDSWQPDVLVVNNFEISGILAAELRGLPYATCNISMRWSRALLRLLFATPINRLRQMYGLPPDPKCLAYGRYLDICLMPSTWRVGVALKHPTFGRMVRQKLFGRNNAQRLPAGKAALMMSVLTRLEGNTDPAKADPKELFVNPYPIRAATSELPEWKREMPNRPTVYVSLGTVFNSVFPEIFDTILAALRDEPINLLITLGSSGDPARFGPQPTHIRIERYIPQDQILPYVDACLNHGGYSTVMGPLLYGLPLVVLPLSADQPVLAQLCLAHGAAVPLPLDVLDFSADGMPVVQIAKITSVVIRAAVRQMLAQPIYGKNARALQAQMQALPSLEHATERLAALAQERPLKERVIGG